MTQTTTPEQLTRHVDSLRPRSDNPRGEISEEDPTIVDLCDSIIDKEVLEPLLISPDGEIWAGHRRRVASRLAYKKTGNEKFLQVPVTIRPLKPGEEPIELMLHENMQRKSLTLAEEARGFAALMLAKNLTVADLARTLKVTTATASNRLAITRCAPEVQALYDADLLPLLAAGHLCKVVDHAVQLKYANMLARHQLNLTELEELVRKEVGKAATIDKESETSGSPVAVAITPHVQQSLTRKVKARKHARNQVVTPAQLEPTRAEAVAALERGNGKSIKLFDVRVLTDAVCNACGMIESPDVCRTCPLPRLLMGIAGRAS